MLPLTCWVPAAWAEESGFRAFRAFGVEGFLAFRALGCRALGFWGLGLRV